ncbi:MAG: flavin reductase family protein [Pseudoramibacter sp.]
MAREYWKPANLLYPIPAVLVSAVDAEGRPNVMTAAWAGTVCSDPVMVSVSIRKSRYTHELISRSGEFVLSLTTERLARAADYCGVKSGRDVDKFAAMHLHPSPSRMVKTPGIAESPVCLECVVTQVLELGSHDMFVAKVVSTDVDAQYLDDKGRFDLDRAHLIAYSHGGYFALGDCLGRFGYSVRKPKAKSQKGKSKAHSAAADQDQGRPSRHHRKSSGRKAKGAKANHNQAKSAAHKKRSVKTRKRKKTYPH